MHADFRQPSAITVAQYWCTKTRKVDVNWSHHLPNWLLNSTVGIHQTKGLSQASCFSGSQTRVLFYWVTSGNSHVFCFTNIREQPQCSVFLINIREQSWRSVSLTSGNSQGVLFSWPTSVTPRNCHSVMLQSDYSVSLTSFRQRNCHSGLFHCLSSISPRKARNRHRCAFKGSDPCLGIVPGVLSKGVIPVCPAAPHGPWPVSTRSVPAKTRQTAASSRRNRVELRSAALPLPRVEEGKPAAPSQVNPTADGASSSTRSSELSKPDWRKGGVHIIPNVYKILL